MADNIFLGSVVAAATVVGLGITWWNNRITQEVSKRKLRLDLFDKRYALWLRLYEQTQKTSAQINRLRYPGSGKVPTVGEISEMNMVSDNIIAEMEYLFPKDCIKASKSYIKALLHDALVRNENNAPVDEDPPILERMANEENAWAARRAAFAAVIESLKSTLDFSDVTKDGEAPPLGSSLVWAWDKAKANRAVLENENRPT